MCNLLCWLPSMLKEEENELREAKILLTEFNERIKFMIAEINETNKLLKEIDEGMKNENR